MSECFSQKQGANAFIAERDRDHMAKKGGRGWGAAVPWGMDVGQVFPPCASFGLVPAAIL